MKILIAMLIGAGVGIMLRFLPGSMQTIYLFAINIFRLGGDLFIAAMKMLVVPVVLISVTCSVCSLENLSSLGKIGGKALGWFFFTTIIATTFAIIFAYLTNLGTGLHLTTPTSYVATMPPTVWQLLGDIVPSNPMKSMVDTNILQIIFFAILFGVAINVSGKPGKRIAQIFADLNVIVMKLIVMLMQIAPYGVLCLFVILFAQQGLGVMLGILHYCLAVVLVLLLHSVVVISLLLRIYNLSPWIFYRKFFPVMLFAFSISSSAASIPVLLENLENKLGVSSNLAAFIAPLGINMNKNGTAIMQAIATLFIAHVYHINIDLLSSVILLLTITLISIGTAGAPGIGMITLVMILKQMGLPAEGIGLIIGVDRLLDMLRTAVNVVCNAAVTCMVARSEQQLDSKIYNSRSSY